MEGPLERYQNLGLSVMFSVSYKYPIACEELSCIIRHCYSKLPKPVRRLVFQDAISAIRMLPEMQMESAVSAANTLLKSVEAKLRRQKRVMAGKEFKQAMVAHKRRNKFQQEETELIELPQDALLHLFSFLDMQSLISAGMVSRSWNAAASDNCLWKVHYSAYFEDSRSVLINKYHVTSMSSNYHVSIPGLDLPMTSMSLECPTHSASTNAVDGTPGSYKRAFRIKFRVSPWRRLKHNRGYCGSCNSIVWLTNLKCTSTHVESRYGNQLIKPIPSTDQIVNFVRYGTIPMMEFAESESDSDEETSFKLWAYPRH